MRRLDNIPSIHIALVQHESPRPKPKDKSFLHKLTDTGPKGWGGVVHDLKTAFNPTTKSGALNLAMALGGRPKLPEGQLKMNFGAEQIPGQMRMDVAKSEKLVRTPEFPKTLKEHVAQTVKRDEAQKLSNPDRTSEGGYYKVTQRKFKTGEAVTREVRKTGQVQHKVKGQWVDFRKPAAAELGVGAKPYKEPAFHRVEYDGLQYRVVPATTKTPAPQRFTRDAAEKQAYKMNESLKNAKAHGGPPKTGAAKNYTKTATAHDVHPAR